jgi:hypothetical protein
MKALIYETRVCQVEEQDFPVATPFYWVACPDDVTTQWTYVDGVFVAPVAPVPTADENKATATSLLQATDWTTISDVGNPQISNPYFANQSDFIIYRNLVRQHAVYPVQGNINWPRVPVEDWVKV